MAVSIYFHRRNSAVIRIYHKIFIMKLLYFSSIFFCSFILVPLQAQEKEALADSTYQKAMQHFMGGEVSTATGYFEQVVVLRAQTDSSKLINCFSNLGRCYAEMGRKEEAWSSYQTAFRLSKKFNNEKSLGYLFNNMGVLEEEQGHPNEAKMYFENGVEVSRKAGNDGSEALCHESLAIHFGKQQDYAQSEKHFVAAFEIYERTNNLPMVSSVLINLGMLASEQKKDSEAIEWLEQSRKIANRLGNYAHVVTAVNGLTQLYLDNGQSKKALQLTNEISPLMDSVELLPVQRDYYQSLSEVYKANGMWQKAFEASNRYYTLRDSVFSEQQKETLVELKTRYEVAEKEQELIFQKAVNQQQRIWQWALGIGLILTGFLAFNWWRAFQNKSRLNVQIRTEQQRSDELLLNILPPAVAEELKTNNAVVARRFENATVLCTDFQDFTGIVSRLRPEQLVQLLDEYFRGFDDITTKFGIEKIKTMGDAYMCVGGLPDASAGTSVHVLRAALAMRDWVNTINKRNMADGKPYFHCRIGLHVGPVVAGIVGKKKFVYDIWGDTVNTATRMEQYGAIDEVNISNTVFQVVVEEPGFQFEYRGEIEVKGKGKLGMYFAREKTPD